MLAVTLQFAVAPMVGGGRRDGLEIRQIRGRARTGADADGPSPAAQRREQR